MTHSIEVKLTIHTEANLLEADAYSKAVHCASTILINRDAIRPGMIAGVIADTGDHVMVEMEQPKTVMGGLIATTLQPHQQRVVAELDQLRERLQKLGKFITDNPSVFLALPLEEQDLLHQQNAAMTAYHDILVQRVAGFARG